MLAAGLEKECHWARVGTMSIKTADLIERPFGSGELDGEVRRRWPMRAPRSWAIQWTLRDVALGMVFERACRMERPTWRLL